MAVGPTSTDQTIAQFRHVCLILLQIKHVNLRVVSIMRWSVQQKKSHGNWLKLRQLGLLQALWVPFGFLIYLGVQFYGFLHNTDWLGYPIFMTSFSGIPHGPEPRYGKQVWPLGQIIQVSFPRFRRRGEGARPGLYGKGKGSEGGGGAYPPLIKNSSQVSSPRPLPKIQGYLPHWPVRWLGEIRPPLSCYKILWICLTVL